MNNNTLPFDIEVTKIDKANNIVVCDLETADKFEEVRYNPIGVEHFDDHFEGIPSKGITVIAAPPGVGKSTTLMHVATNLSNQGKKILYISVENLPFIDQQHYIEAKEKYCLKNNVSIKYVNFVPESINDINSIISAEYDYVFIDGSEILAGATEETFSGYVQLSKQLYKITNEMNIPIVVSWQAKREAKNCSEDEVTDSLLFYGTRIIQLASMVICIYIDKNTRTKRMKLVKTRLPLPLGEYSPLDIERVDGSLDLRGCNA